VIGSMPPVEGQGYGGLPHSIGLALCQDYDAGDEHANMIGRGIP